ncbi:hypothetical protein E0Z10_g1536 [Xylaria hypoxylon]|uniref:Rhodopsin domain-containing protein n=1 Tax=Xylaria hypoxylon TaxID=37992 RepID=A0A4Z0ZEG6_9PEZI|nr:hypothetical protein E0Z10_g1536 [Xylaria hypoxylon]
MSQYEPNPPSPPDLCMLAAGDPPAGTTSNFESPDTLAPTLFSIEITSTFTLFFSKVSIFLLFHQIFEVRRLMRIAIHLPHVGETWAGTLVGRNTEPEVIWGIVQAVLGTGLDLFIFILLIPGIMKLHLPTKKKIQVLAVFTTASVGVLASILSLVYRVAALEMNDVTWSYTSIVIWNVVETDVAIIASCTPGFASFIRTYIPKLEVFKSLGSNDNSDANLNHDLDKLGAEKGFRRLVNHAFDPLDDAYLPQSISSAERGPFLHCRRRQDRTAEDKCLSSQQKEDEVQPPDLNGLYEAGNWRIIREAPNGAVYGMAVHPADKPDDHLREMASLPGEMPAPLPLTRPGGDGLNLMKDSKFIGEHGAGK